MAEQVHQPLLKRQRLAAIASASGGKAGTAVSGEPAPQTVAGAQQPEQLLQASPPPKQQAGGASSNSGAPKKQKQLVMPTPVHPPTAPADPAAWDNAVLLVDKPKEWTSFDVCGKLRPALAALLGKKNREVKVGHAGGWLGLPGAWHRPRQSCPAGTSAVPAPLSAARRRPLPPLQLVPCFAVLCCAVQARWTPWPPACSSCAWGGAPRRWMRSWPCTSATAGRCGWGRARPRMTQTRLWSSERRGSTSRVGLEGGDGWWSGVA